MGEEKYYDLELPSRLIPYQGVSKVEIRMLKGRDEKLIGEFSVANFEKKFKSLLDNVLRGIDPNQLTLGDRTYIVVWLAMNCYSPVYPIDILCEHCFKKTEKYEIQLGTLDKLYLPPAFKEPYPITLSDGKTQLSLRLYRVADQIQYLDHVEQKGSDDLLFKMAQSIVTSDDMSKRIAFLEELPTKDMALIRAFHDKYLHGVKFEAKYTCGKCGGVGVMPIPFRLDLLFPTGETIERSLGRSI